MIVQPCFPSLMPESNWRPPTEFPEIWQAKAFGVRKRQTIVEFRNETKFDFVNRFLSGKIIRFNSNGVGRQKNYYVADGIKLVSMVEKYLSSF